jgi:hypothetical protein
VWGCGLESVMKGSCGGFLWTRQCFFEFHKRRGMFHKMNDRLFPPEGGVGWVRPRRGYLLTLAYYSSPDMSLERNGGMIDWQGKIEELGEKPVPVPLCPPQIPHGLPRARTPASAVRGRRLTTWDRARPSVQPSVSRKVSYLHSCER